jgi:hypothetical protein
MTTETHMMRVVRNTVHDLGSIRAGILDARKDFPRMYDFYSGKCESARFGEFLAIGDFYTEPLTRQAWRRTIFKEIDRVDALFAHQ